MDRLTKAEEDIAYLMRKLKEPGRAGPGRVQIDRDQRDIIGDIQIRKYSVPGQLFDIQLATLGGAADKTYTNPTQTWRTLVNNAGDRLEFFYTPPHKCDMLLFAQALFVCDTSPYAYAARIYEYTDAETISSGHLYAAAILGASGNLVGLKRNLQAGTEYQFGYQWYPWTTGAGVDWTISRDITQTMLIGVPCRLP